MDKTRNLGQDSTNPRSDDVSHSPGDPPVHDYEYYGQKITGALQLRELAQKIRTNSSPNTVKEHQQYWRDLSQMDDTQLKQVYARLSKQSHKYLGLPEYNSPKVNDSFGLRKSQPALETSKAYRLEVIPDSTYDRLPKVQEGISNQKKNNFNKFKRAPLGGFRNVLGQHNASFEPSSLNQE